MTTATIETTSRLPDLSDDAFEAFCEDLSGMFGVEMRCERRHVGTEAVKDLRKRFKKLTAVHLVTAEGVLDGTFHLFFDQGALFVLSGVVVMLPEHKIRQHVKRGSMADAENMGDAAWEVGNLLVGSWDRVFREDCEGHGHFVKKSTVLGKLAENLPETGLSDEDELLVVVYEMTVDPYPGFTCAAVFPQTSLGNDAPGPAAGDDADPAQATAGGEPQAGAEEAPAADAPPQEAPSEKAPAPAQPRDHASEPAEPSTPAPSHAPKSDRMVEEPGGDPAADAVVDVGAESLAGAGIVPAAGLTGGADPVFLNPSYIRSDSSPADPAVADLLRTPAAEIMRKEVVWCTPDDSVQDVIARMQQHGTGYVLVGESGALEGLVSGSNILAAVSLYLRPMFAKYHRPEDDATLAVKVKWIMSRPVRTVGPDTSLAKMMEMICRHGGRCLPVVGAEGGVQGIVTIYDILVRVLNADGSFSWKGAAPPAPPLLL